MWKNKPAAKILNKISKPISVADILYDLQHERLGDIQYRKNSESVGHVQEIITKFNDEMIKYLHQPGNNAMFTKKLEDLTINSLVKINHRQSRVNTRAKG